VSSSVFPLISCLYPDVVALGYADPLISYGLADIRPTAATEGTTVVLNAAAGKI
jgi:hypothetical protein